MDDKFYAQICDDFEKQRYTDVLAAIGGDAAVLAGVALHIIEKRESLSLKLFLETVEDLSTTS